MIKYELDIHVFFYLNCLFLFLVSLQTWRAHFLPYKKQWRNSQKYSFSLLFFLRHFQWYRYKSHIAIFVWRVAWEYGHSPFNIFISSSWVANFWFRWRSATCLVNGTDWLQCLNLMNLSRVSNPPKTGFN